MISFLFGKILYMSISATIACIMVFVIWLSFKRFFSKGWGYYLWLIPILMFLIPLSFSDFEPITRTSFVSEPTETNTTSSKPDTQNIDTNTAPTVKTTRTEAIRNTIVTKTRNVIKDQQLRPLPFAEVIALIWFIGVLLIISGRQICGIRFRRRLRRFCISPSDKQEIVFNSIKLDMNIKSKVVLKVLDAPVSPFLTGIKSPMIVVPTTVSDSELSPVLMHELTHLKRHDLWYQALIHVICTIHWFNPFTYILDSFIKKMMELSCDEAVTSTMNNEQRHYYGLSVLTLMKKNKHFIKNSLFLSENASDLKQRLEVIMKNKKYSISRILISTLLSVCVLCSTTALALTVNDQNPAKSAYAVNRLMDVASFTYKTGDTPIKEYGIDNGTGTGYGERDVVLINTPLHKSFYMKISIDNYQLDNASKNPDNYHIVNTYDDPYISLNQGAVETPIICGAEIEILMNGAPKVIDNGNEWVGEFTATINGYVIADGMLGTITNIPSDKKYGMTDLSIRLRNEDNSIIYLSTSQMNFNITGDDLLNAEIVNENNMNYLMEHQDTKSIYYTSDDETKYTMNLEINPTLAQLYAYFDNCASSLKLTYTITDGTAQGIFFVTDPITSVRDEVMCTVTNLNGEIGEKINIISDDRSINKSYIIAPKPTFDYETAIYYDGPDPVLRDFEMTKNVINTRIDSSDFPFTIELSPEKDNVILTKKDDPNYEYWKVILATYNSPTLVNIWEERPSTDGETTLTIPIMKNSTRNHLIFSGINTIPSLSLEDIELIFTMSDDELVYVNGRRSVTTNENYVGEDAISIFKNYYIIGDIIE